MNKVLTIRGTTNVIKMLKVLFKISTNKIFRALLTVIKKSPSRNNGDSDMSTAVVFWRKYTTQHYS